MQYESFNHTGERFTPHVHADGYFRCVVYRTGDKGWNKKERYLLIDKDRLDWAQTQPNFYIRMRGNDSGKLSFFSVARVGKAAASS